MVAYKVEVEGMHVPLPLDEDFSSLIDGDEYLGGEIVAGVSHGELLSMDSHFNREAKAVLED